MMEMFELHKISFIFRLFISPLCPFYFESHSADSLAGLVEEAEPEIGQSQHCFSPICMRMSLLNVTFMLMVTLH